LIGNVSIGGVIRLLLLGAMLPLLLLPRQVGKFGSVEVITTEGGIEIRRGSSGWNINIFELPVRANDCQSRQERESCQALPKQSPCSTCIRYPEVFAWDEPHQTLYFAVATSESQNRPWIIFRYSLRTRRVTRIVSDYGAGYSIGAVSRSGQYLAYVAWATNGICGTQSSIVIIDLWSRRSTSTSYETRSDDEIVEVQSLRWATAAALEYSAEIHSESDCRNSASGQYPKRTVTDRVDLAKIGFR
jgi:hypothetical protein